MGIAQKVARNFSDAVRSRGQSYFIKGRVTLLTARAGEVVARVRGTSKYRVRVRLRGSKLLASCTCPYFSPQREPCKHLWATLLLAEARALLQSPPVFPVHLVAESPRQTSQEGLLDSRTSPTLDRQPAGLEELDLGLEMMGLVPSRPIGPNVRGGNIRRNDRPVHGREPHEQGELGPTESYVSRIPAGREAGLKPRPWESGPTQVRRNQERLIVMPNDCSFTFSM